jgi:hypothetical protein
MTDEAFELFMEYIDAAIADSTSTHLQDSIRKRQLRDELAAHLIDEQE